MHGRPRKIPKPEEKAAAAVKAEKLRALQSQFLSNHHNHSYTKEQGGGFQKISSQEKFCGSAPAKEALGLNAKLLETNPECYTAWNYMKLAVQQNLAHSESDPDSVKAIIEEELRVVENALRQNFKSYGAWHHRKWVLSRGHSSVDHELRLVNRFQEADSRNFHAWNYRRFLAALMNRSAEDELCYTTKYDKCQFYVLLSDLLKRKVQGFFPKEKVLNEEYEFVHQAIFTDPDDQSGWFYYLWLLDQTVKTDAPLLVSSWPARCSNVLLSEDRCSDDSTLSPFCYLCDDSDTFPLILYFNQAVEGVTSNKDAFLRHCYQYRNQTVSNSRTYICLHLNNLSLSRMGSIKNLLWIQMLDLSRNELRSIEGLEAMQLLCCLNLSYNKLASFTSLGPLRLLKSLKVLNISHNEIGSHSIDTWRYLFPSPLSHTQDIDWNADEIAIGDYNVRNYWEAFSIFKSSNLRQLDISGNPIADEKFKSFFIRLLPKLYWLDGERLH